MSRGKAKRNRNCTPTALLTGLRKQANSLHATNLKTLTSFLNAFDRGLVDDADTTDVAFRDFVHTTVNANSNLRDLFEARAAATEQKEKWDAADADEHAAGDQDDSNDEDVDYGDN